VKRGLHVHLCKSPDRRHCVRSGAWDSGFIVYVDENGDGRADAGESLLRAEGRAPPGITVVGNAPVEDYVSYTSMGTARLVNGALQMGTFTVCRSGRRGIDVVLANSGRVRLQKSTAPCP
jgi:type IV fimbrial biogenesis protein FimT